MVDVERNKRLSAPDREMLGARLERAYGKGTSIASLAQEAGTSAGRVRLILLERGVVLRPRGGNVRKPDPGRSKRAKALAAEYRGGASLAQLAATHGINATTARNLVLAGGGDLRARGGRKPADQAE